MSSAILYLAIVAIWAGFLIPAWLRRPHQAKVGPEDEADLDGELDGQDVTADALDTESGEAAGEPAETHAEAGSRDQEYGNRMPANGAEHDVSGSSGAQDHSGRPGDPRSVADPPPALPQSREQMMRARRRMLTILVTMTAVTGAFALIGSAAWWICVPPAGMLVLYVLLLREIAMAEAEMAVKRQVHAAHEARRAQLAQAEREREDQAAAEENEQTAQIIDISSRVGDQLYDQYADAAVRAVGD